MSEQKIIIAFYINVSGLTPEKAHERMLDLYNVLEMDKGDDEKHIIVPVNHESKVEVLNPVRLSDEDYKSIEDRVSKIEKRIEELLSVKNES